MDQEQDFIEEMNRLKEAHPGVIAFADVQDDNFVYMGFNDPIDADRFTDCLKLVFAAADRFEIDIGMDIDEGVTPEDALLRFGDFGFAYSGDMNLVRHSGATPAIKTPEPAFSP